MSTKIRKGDVVLAKDLTEDYWGSEIEVSTAAGIKYTMVLKRHRAVYQNTLIDLFPEGNGDGVCLNFPADTEVTILTPPKPNHPEQPTEMGTIIQIEGHPLHTFVVDYDGGILSLLSANHLTWVYVKQLADSKGAKIIVSKPTASYDDGLADIRTRDGWDPSKEELYRTRQWRDRMGDTWSFKNGRWGYFPGSDGLRFSLGGPSDFTPLTLVPKDEEIS